MKKLTFVLTALFILMSTQGFSQKDRLSLFGGFDYEFIVLQPDLGTSKSYLPYYGVTFGANYVMLHSNDVFSLGINPNVNFSFSFLSGGGITLLAQAPIYLLAKYGAGSTNYNEQKFGIGAGIGLSYSYLYIDIPSIDKISQGFATPEAMVQISYRAGNSIYTVRAHKSLYRAKHVLDSDEWLFKTFGFGLVYSF